MDMQGLWARAQYTKGNNDFGADADQFDRQYASLFEWEWVSRETILAQNSILEAQKIFEELGVPFGGRLAMIPDGLSRVQERMDTREERTVRLEDMEEDVKTLLDALEDYNTNVSESPEGLRRKIREKLAAMFPHIGSRLDIMEYRITDEVTRLSAENRRLVAENAVLQNNGKSAAGMSKMQAQVDQMHNQGLKRVRSDSADDGRKNLGELRKENEKLGRDLDVLRADLRSANEAKDRYQTLTATLQGRVWDLEKEGNTLKEEGRISSANAAGLHNRLEEVEVKRSAAIRCRDAYKAKRDELMVQLIKLRDINTQQKTDLDNAQNSIKILNNRARDLETEELHWNTRLYEKVAECAWAQEELKLANSKINGLRNQLQHQQAIDALPDVQRELIRLRAEHATAEQITGVKHPKISRRC